MWRLLQIELFKISRRPRTYIAFAAITAIVLIFQFAFKADGSSYMNLMMSNVQDSFEIDRSKAINGYFMCYIILNTLLVQVPILVALIAGDAISGEANMGTLRLLLTKPVSRTQLLLAKFLASFLFTIALLIWMAITALFLSMAIFGVDDMLIFRVKGEESQIMQITQDDVFWRYLAAFAYAAVALTVIAALAILLSVFAENSIGPIVATVCIVIVCTVISNINVPIIDRTIKPWLFTSYLVGWKGFFYIGTTADGE
ncbi:MAG TPA: ABC transporter permease subunit, partial [Ferruginibacter sp.]|nr:ABC transporter permease subunit [Ferruginibacter sp.]